MKKSSIIFSDIVDLNARMEMIKLSSFPKMPNYHDIVFVDNVQDWTSVY